MPCPTMPTSPRVPRRRDGLATAFAGARIPTALAALIAALLAHAAAPAAAQQLDPNLWVTDGFVTSAAFANNTLYIGGDFHRVGPPTGGFAVFDSVGGALAVQPPRVSGIVLAMASDGAGGWFIGGDFTHAGGQPRRNLAHVLANGSVDAWNPGANATVSALARDGSVLYVGGRFDSLGTQARTWLGAVDTGTGVATAWNPAADGYVNCMLMVGTRLYVGGAFGHLFGATRGCLGAFDLPTGALAAAWVPPAVGGEVRALSANATNLFAAGNFLVQTPARTYLASFSLASGAVTTWAPAVNAAVNSIAVSASTVYVAGDFSTAAGNARNGLAALSPVLNQVTSWNPAPDAKPSLVSLAGNTLYVSGPFTTIGGQFNTRFAAVDATTGIATEWNPSPNDVVTAMATSAGRVVAAGRFATAGGVTRNHLAAIDVATGQPTAWAPEPGGPVSAVAVVGSTVLAAAKPPVVFGTPTSQVIAYDGSPAGGVPLWTDYTNGNVSQLVAANGYVYIAGNYTQIAGQSRPRLVRVQPGTGALSPWAPNPSSTPLEIAVGGVVYWERPGGFLDPNGYYAAIDTASGAPLAFSATSFGGGQAMAVGAGGVFVGGGYVSMNGITRSNLAKLDATSGATLAFDPGPNNSVSALVLSGSTLYVGGYFTTINGQERHGIAALDPVLGSVQAWRSDMEGNVQTLVRGNGRLFAAGSFWAAGGYSANGLASFLDPGSVDAPAPRVAEGLQLAVGPNPLRGSAEVTFALPVAGEARVDVYDAAGRRVAVLARDAHAAGVHRATWTRAAASPGVYFVRLQAAGEAVTRRVVVVE